MFNTDSRPLTMLLALKKPAPLNPTSECNDENNNIKYLLMSVLLSAR